MASILTLTPGASDPKFPVNAGALPTGTSATSVQMPYWKFDATGAVTQQNAA